MLIGKIHSFNSRKGFGFIRLKSGADVFVHYSVIQGHGYRTLYEGQEVCYQIIRGKHGLTA
ncbi:MAG: cold-shock protein, partial [Phascolarctobacterium sp.]|nr:cold-shock protein [Phascolarctobacterium sp.]